MSQYTGMVLVFHQQKLFGVFESEGEAYFAAKDEFEEGTFSIIRCSPGPSAYTVNHRTIKNKAKAIPL